MLVSTRFAARLFLIAGLTLAPAPVALAQEGVTQDAAAEQSVPGEPAPGYVAPGEEFGADAPAPEYGTATEPADLPISSDDVRQVQRQLREKGYLTGPADGRRSERLRVALSAFQRDQNLPVTGSLDQATLDALGPRRVAAQPPPPATQAPASVPAQAPRSSGKDLAEIVTIGAKGTAKGAVVGGKAVGKAGEATGKAGAVAGKGVATAGTATWNAGKTAARATGKAAVVAYDATTGAVGWSRDRFRHERRTDDQIQRSIEAQFAEDSRIVPSEVEVRVSNGNVTLAVAEGARTDTAYAVRLAKLTHGVRSVNAIHLAPPIVTNAPDSPASDPDALQQPAPATDDTQPPE